MKTTIGYVRVSTQRQGTEGVSLEAQEAAIRDYCERKGLGEPVVISDTASGKDLNRPGIREVIARTEAGEVGHVVVYRLDRLSRKTLDALTLIGEVFDGHTGFHSVKQDLDTSTAQGRFFAGQLVLFAELEREMIAERTREAAGACIAQGKQFGALPYGYKKGEDGKTLARCEKEWPVVERIRREREELSYSKIAAGLNADGIPTKRGGKWYGETVRCLLTRKRNGADSGPAGADQKTGR